MAEFSDFNIVIPPGRTSGEIYTKCPECSANRKAHNKNAKPLAVSLDKGVWTCNNCGWKGSLQNGHDHSEKPKAEPPPKVKQKFIDEPEWNWIFPDTIIDPKPDNDTQLIGAYTITWYYRDLHGRLTAAKKMQYNFGDGKMLRDHESPPMHLFTRDSGYYPSLFFEHNLSRFPDATVLLVESEKTAAMLTRKFSHHLPEFIYIATGGAKGLTDDKIHVLKNRTIWLCYDCDNGELQPDGSIKNPKGREGAFAANEKLQKIADSRVIDIDPSKTDGTDLADIIKTIDIEYIRALPTKIPLKVKEMWDSVLIDKEPPPEVPILFIQDIPVCTHGNYSLVVGKKKSRKSLFIQWLIAQFFTRPKSSPEECLLFDTEQGRRRAYLMRERIKALTGYHIPVFDLRGKSPKERIGIIEESLHYWPVIPKLIIIDGIRDLMTNINDPVETTELIVWVEKIIQKYNCHIIFVLHLNKTDGNARGHLGTELQNKVEISIELELDEKTNITNVKTESSRDKPFEPFAFHHGKDGLPELLDVQTQQVATPIPEKRLKIIKIFEEGPLKYNELLKEVGLSFGLSKNKSEKVIRDAMDAGWMVKSGKYRDPKAVYKCVISENEPDHVYIEPQQEMSFEPQQAFEPPEPISEDLPF